MPGDNLTRPSGKLTTMVFSPRMNPLQYFDQPEKKIHRTLQVIFLAYIRFEMCTAFLVFWDAVTYCEDAKELRASI
jgi:hypothetical protein